jgi:cytidine deaminase
MRRNMPDGKGNYNHLSQKIVFSHIIPKIRFMEHIRINFELEAYPSADELSDGDKELLQQALQATGKAYSPYSLFSVGAAVRLKSGKIVTGNNQENAAYPSGLCAERVALFYASANYPDETVEAIAITARAANFKVSNPATPCGACRQVMMEIEGQNRQKIRVIMQGENGKVLVSKSVENLLPMSFQGDQLKK